MKNLPFKALADVFTKLEQTASSLQMIDILAEFFKKCGPEEARMAAYLMRGQVAPEYVEDMDFGVARKLAARAVARAYKEKTDKVEALMNKLGDLGNATEQISGKKHVKVRISLQKVFEELNRLAVAHGTGSQEQKLDILAGILSRSSGIEARYVVRIVLGTLRLGVAEMTFLNALSVAITGSKEAKPTLEHAFNVMPDIGEIAEQTLSKGITGLKNIAPKPGVPIKVMLAQRVKELEEVHKNIPGEVYVEYKYDGERVQAHILNQKSTINVGSRTPRMVLFSRRHENITHQFPDLIAALQKSFSGESAILEGEVVAVDQNNPDKLLPFQTLMQRRRKHNIAEFAQKIPIRYMIFDILSLDGRSLLQKPLKERKEFIKKNFSQTDQIEPIEGLLTKELAEEEEFFNNAIAHGAEGIMIKDAASPYKAGARGWQWIKFKKDYQEGLADSFDLVVVGALHGAGRRGGTYGSLLAASYDPDTGRYYSFTKVGAGLTDQNLAGLYKKLNKYKIKEKHRLLETGMNVDVWFEPAVVMEVAGAEITVSPVHTVAKKRVDKAQPSSANRRTSAGQDGLALRFPRFLRWRNDKKPTQATTVKEILEIFNPS